MRRLLCKSGGDAEFDTGRDPHLSGELQLGKIGEIGRVSLVGKVGADGQPAGDADVVTGFAGHAHVGLFGRRRRQVHTPGLGLNSGGIGRRWWSLLGRGRRLLRGSCCAGAVARGPAGRRAAGLPARPRHPAAPARGRASTSPVQQDKVSQFEKSSRTPQLSRLSRHGPVRDHSCTKGSKPSNCWLPSYFASNQWHGAENQRLRVVAGSAQV